MFRTAARLARPAAIIVTTLLVNLAIPSPMIAAWDDDVCIEESGETVPCCTFCIFFCHCSE